MCVATTYLGTRKVTIGWTIPVKVILQAFVKDALSFAAAAKSTIRVGKHSADKL